MARNSKKTRRRTNNNTQKHKAAWIGFAGAILAALIAGTFALFNTSNKTTGSCSQIITGDIQGEIQIDCQADK